MNRWKLALPLSITLTGLSSFLIASAQEITAQRIFNKMFDRLSAAPEPADGELRCRVRDPTGTPLNVRESPNGAIQRTIANGEQVRVMRFAMAANGKSWAYVSDRSGGEIGWVFLPYLSCAPR